MHCDPNQCLTFLQVQGLIDQIIQSIYAMVGGWRRETRYETCEHAELLPTAVVLKCLKPQEKQAHSFKADLKLNTLITYLQVNVK